MKVDLVTTEQVQEFCSEMLRRAHHHAPDWVIHLLVLQSWLINNKDPGTHLVAWRRNGELTTGFWVTIAGCDYFLRLDRGIKSIEVRQNSIRGRFLCFLSPTTPIDTFLRDLEVVFGVVANRKVA